MADARIIQYGKHISAGSTAISDNSATALDIESTDGEDYIRADTTDDASKLLLLSTFTDADNVSSGVVGIRTATPVAPLHIIGTGGATGATESLTDANSPTVFIENGNANSKARCELQMQSTGASGSVVSLFHSANRRLEMKGTDTRSFVTGYGCILRVDTSGTNNLELGTNETARMTITGAGGVIFAAMPTSDPSTAGQLWSDSGAIKISAG